MNDPGSSANKSKLGDPLSSVPARCPGCYSRDQRTGRPSVVEGSFQVVTCADCGQMYTSPRPDSASWDCLYPPDYGPYQVRVSDLARWQRRSRRDRWLLSHCRPAPELDMSPMRMGIRAVVSLLTRGLLDPRFVSPTGSGRLLDVGCGAGNYLARMAVLGWDVLGVDRSSHAAERAQRQWNLPVVVANVPGPDVPRGSFDLITMWEVLEHLDRPRQALACLRDRLSPHGRLVLSVPNQGGWASHKFGRSWVAWDVPRHLSHFTRDTLVAMLAAEGLEATCTTTIRHPSWIRHSAPKVSIYRRRWCASIASRLAERDGKGESLFVVAKGVSGP